VHSLFFLVFVLAGGLMTVAVRFGPNPSLSTFSNKGRLCFGWTVLRFALFFAFLKSLFSLLASAYH